LSAVTILMPVFNRQEFVAEAIEAAAWQSHQGTRVLVYDDGSTDGSLSAIERALNRMPGEIAARVEVHRGEHVGHGPARRWLLENCQTDLMAWLDSDDWCDPLRVESQLELLERDRLDVCFSWLRFFSGTSPRASRIIKEIYPSTWTVKRSSLTQMGTGTAFFNRRAADLALAVPVIQTGGWDVVWCLSLVAAGMRLGCVPRPLYSVRRHPGRITARKNLPEINEQRVRDRAIIAEACARIEAGEVPGVT